MRKGPDPFWTWRFRKMLRREKIDLLHTHEFEMNAYGAAAAISCGVPSVATLHGSVAGVDGKHLLAYRALGKFGQRMVAVSRDLESTLSDRLGGRHHSIQVIHNGTNVPPQESQLERDRQRVLARAEIGIPVGGSLIVAIGNLYLVKDHATLLRAAAQIPSARVAIAGRGEEEGPLKSLAEQLGISDRIHLLGLRDDVPRVLKAADIFAQPSLSEGLPLAILEAMASHLPIVATNVGGVGEAVAVGETGYLVPVGSPNKLAAALKRLIDDPGQRQALGEAGYARALDEFSVATMTNRYLKLYREMTK
jgi:glycosyltransferase involved in cell wall biosynthesis